MLPKALPLLAPLMNEGGTILCEHPAGLELPREAGSFEAVRTYRYGKIMTTIYRRQAQEGQEER